MNEIETLKNQVDELTRRIEVLEGMLGIGDDDPEFADDVDDIATELGPPVPNARTEGEDA